MRTRNVVGIALVLSLTLVGCDRGERLSPDASYFQGLPRSVVDEALGNPTVRRNLQGDPQAMMESLAQASVRQIIFCREALRIYEGWIDTGEPPTISPGPVPAHPIEPGNGAIQQDYASLKETVSSGDPIQLRSYLTGNGGCGQWVPAAPGDIDGATVAQVIEGPGH